MEAVDEKFITIRSKSQLTGSFLSKFAILLRVPTLMRGSVANFSTPTLLHSRREIPRTAFCLGQPPSSPGWPLLLLDQLNNFAFNAHSVCEQRRQERKTAIGSPCRKEAKYMTTHFE